MRASRWLLALAIVSSVSSAALAAPRNSWAWDGTWRGAWGGSQAQATSITIANQRVVSYEYGGASTPVSASKVTAKRVTYGDNGNFVTMTRTGRATAFATLHSSQGDATAKLTRD